MTNTYENRLGEQITLSEEQIEEMVRNMPDSAVLDIPTEINDKDYFLVENFL